ncbi:ArsR/SmtB family transcription factor [Phycisphaerales bacterium AB-hyl4]|uniref:ArsR/SmtB family transcription factor n=1 Tax=Natronomicrosphaera hydrolytica TaxID=3242702 RepID=A0ABV4U973_9BACT
MISAPAQPDALLRWMGSLAEPTRLRLLRLLEQHELGVSDLCDVVQMPQSTVSRHLKLLSDEGWLVSRRQGTTNRYRMVLDELAPSQRKLWLLAREQSSEWSATEQDQLRLAERLRRKRDDSQAFFAGAAGEWDRLRNELYGSAFSRESLLALLPGELVVADLGCGTGSLSADLARFVGKVIGVDNSPAMLDAARQRTAAVDNVELRQGDVEAVPIDDGTCDAAIQALVLTYVPEPIRVVQEMHRILKPGGVAVVVDLLKHDREDFRRQMGQQSMGFEPEGLNQLLTEAGFEKAQSWPVPPEERARGPALLVGRARKK